MKNILNIELWQDCHNSKKIKVKFENGTTAIVKPFGSTYQIATHRNFITETANIADKFKSWLLS